jgi:hypothetical protein
VQRTLRGVDERRSSIESAFNSQDALCAVAGWLHWNEHAADSTRQAQGSNQNAGQQPARARIARICRRKIRHRSDRPDVGDLNLAPKRLSRRRAVVCRLKFLPENGLDAVYQRRASVCLLLRLQGAFDNAQ